MSLFPDFQRTVLYVEDNPANAMLMRALFERRPELRLVVAGSGAEAERAIVGLDPVLLLLDLRLPDCNGAQLLPRLRQHSEVPAIAVTADDDFRIAGTGFCELWVKPLDILQVLARLAALTAVPSVPVPAARAHGRAWPEAALGLQR